MSIKMTSTSCGLVAKCRCTFLTVDRQMHNMAKSLQPLLHDPTVDRVIFGNKDTHMLGRDFFGLSTLFQGCIIDFSENTAFLGDNALGRADSSGILTAFTGACEK